MQIRCCILTPERSVKLMFDDTQEDKLFVILCKSIFIFRQGNGRQREGRLALISVIFSLLAYG